MKFVGIYKIWLEYPYRHSPKSDHVSVNLAVY